MILGTFALILVGVLGFWIFGGVALRALGLVFALLALAGLVLSPSAGAVVVLAIGVILWMAGHWHYALRHHAYKSPLAERVFLQLLPGRLDPTRGWGVPVIPMSPDYPGVGATGGARHTQDPGYSDAVEMPEPAADMPSYGNDVSFFLRRDVPSLAIFGEVWTWERVIEGLDADEIDQERRLHDQGLRWCTCYSTACVNGEGGHVHTSQMALLTAVQFDEFRAAGWTCAEAVCAEIIAAYRSLRMRSWRGGTGVTRDARRGRVGR